MKRGYKALLDAANAEIEAVAPADAAKLAENDDVVLIDLRDVRELKREGRVPGAVHAPRGMLEFWVDPASPYHKAALGEAMADGRKLVLFCASAWRSALSAATLADMGVENIAEISGGFSAWRAAGLPVNRD